MKSSLALDRLIKTEYSSSCHEDKTAYSIMVLTMVIGCFGFILNIFSFLVWREHRNKIAPHYYLLGESFLPLSSIWKHQNCAWRVQRNTVQYILIRLFGGVRCTSATVCSEITKNAKTLGNHDKKLRHS